ncbi:MAG: extracellular solute-binding protein [Armatimonadetes bacterium]|nr:extracellular solute-binding protein [Armatimonadota bacterium]
MITKGTLRTALVSGPPYDLLYDRIPQFESEAGWQVEIAHRSPPGDLAYHLEGALLSGTPYDVVSVDTRTLGRLSPWLLPLGDALPAEDWADFYPLAAHGCRVAGVPCALPRAMRIPLLHYRSDLLEDNREIGWYQEDTDRALRVPETWEELAAVAQYFTRPPRIYGFPFAGRAPALVGLFGEMMGAYGGALFDPMGPPRFATPLGGWVAFLLRDLYRRWSTTPEESLEWGDADVADAFRRGSAAMARDWPESFADLRDSARSSVAGWLALAPPPAGIGGRRRAWTTVLGFAVPQASLYRDGAVALARFLTDKMSQRVDAQMGAFPARESATIEYGDTLREGSLSRTRWRLLEQAARSHAVCPPTFPGYLEAEETLGAALRSVLQGYRDPGDALRQAQRDIEAAMEEG